MKLSSYVVVHDYGFAPNPFGGVLTMATCKPDIRKTATVGNWLMGTGSAKGAGQNRLIYAGQIARVLTIEKYGTSAEFAHKIPSTTSGRWGAKGDNIYYKSNGEWCQRKNPFHGKNDMTHDLDGKNVIICESFWYFGNNAPEIPDTFSTLIKLGPKHKNNTRNPIVPNFLDWLRAHPAGLTGEPSSVKA